MVLLSPAAPPAPVAQPTPPATPPTEPRRLSVTIQDGAEIDRYLAAFKSKSGRAMRAVLQSQGLRIERVLAQPVENFSPGIGHPSDQPGDVYVTVIAVPLKTGAKMPCDMDRDYKPKDGTPATMSMIFRGQAFLPDPSGEDALMHWVRTGRCMPE